MNIKHWIPWSVRIWLFTVALVVAAVPAGPAFGQNPNQPKIFNSGMELRYDFSDRDIYWLDDQRIIFLAHDRYWNSPEGVSKELLSIMIWEVRTNQLKKYAGPGVHGLCVGEGIVRYLRRRIDLNKYDEIESFAGVLGKERRISSGKIDPDTCLEERELAPLPEWAKGKWIKRLRPQDGFVESMHLPGGGRVASYPIKLYRFGASQNDGIALPDILKKDIHPIYKYFTFERAYLLTEIRHGSPWPEGVAQSLWWLYPNGQVTEIAAVTRDKTWPSTNIDSYNFVPTKAGLFFGGAENSASRQIGQSGLYRFVVNGKPERIIEGRIGAKALSPDGCMLAFGNDDRPSIGGFNQHKLQVIQLCKDK